MEQQRWNGRLLTGEDRITRNKSCPSGTLSTANSTRTDLGWANRLSNDTINGKEERIRRRRSKNANRRITLSTEHSLSLERHQLARRTAQSDVLQSIGYARGPKHKTLNPWLQFLATVSLKSSWILKCKLNVHLYDCLVSCTVFITDTASWGNVCTCEPFPLYPPLVAVRRTILKLDYANDDLWYSLFLRDKFSPQHFAFTNFPAFVETTNHIFVHTQRVTL
jgi:hypothetical protein